ncbi:hypothetical protein EI555_005642, partial [Monodon monoceros]
LLFHFIRLETIRQLRAQLKPGAASKRQTGQGRGNSAPPATRPAAGTQSALLGPPASRRGRPGPVPVETGDGDQGPRRDRAAALALLGGPRRRRTGDRPRFAAAQLPAVRRGAHTAVGPTLPWCAAVPLPQTRACGDAPTAPRSSGMRRAGAVGVLNFEGPLGRQHIFNCAAAVGPAVRERRAAVGPRRQEEEAAGPRGAGVPWLREARDLVRPKVDLTGCQPRTPPPPPPGSLSPGAGPDGRPRSPAQPPIGPYAAWRSAFAPGSGSHWPRVAQSPAPCSPPIGPRAAWWPTPAPTHPPIGLTPAAPPRASPVRSPIGLTPAAPPLHGPSRETEPWQAPRLAVAAVVLSRRSPSAFTSPALVPRLFSSPSIYCLPYVSLPALLPSLREPESRARGHPAPPAPPTLGLRVQRCPRSPSCSFPPPLSSSLRHFAFSFLP